MRKILFLLVVFIFLGMVLLSSCAKPPEQEMQTARDAVANAINVEANLYASDLLMLAQDSLIQAETFFGERKYADAKKLALFAKSWADSATTVAITNKEQMKTTVEAVVNDTSTKLETLKRSFQNEPNGFRNIFWGTPIDSLKVIMEYNSSGEFKGEKIDYYTRKGDDLSIGSVNLKAIFYHFWKGKFTDVSIPFKAEASEDIVGRLSTILRIQFGNKCGYGERSYLKQYNWTGKITTIIMEFDGVTYTEGILYFYSTKLRDEMEQEIAKKNSQGGKDF